MKINHSEPGALLYTYAQRGFVTSCAIAFAFGALHFFHAPENRSDETAAASEKTSSTTATDSPAPRMRAVRKNEAVSSLPTLRGYLPDTLQAIGPRGGERRAQFN